MRLPLLLYPNRFLREVSTEVDPEYAKSVEFKLLLDSLRETLIWFHGVGISAVQTGFAERVFVMRLSSGGYQSFVNPVLEEVDGPTGVEPMQEGCLSVPGVVETVLRYPNVIVSALDIESGERKRYDLEGIEAQCAQHEMEHLNGKMFTDDYGPVKRDIVKRKVKKAVRHDPLFKELS